MKLFHLLSILTICTLISMSCGNGDKDKIRQQARESLPAVQPSNAPVTAPPPVQAPANTTVPAGNEPHYKCPSNCVGGGGPSAGNCPVCGIAMVHNAAYHNQPQPSATTTPTPSQPATTSPAQNAAGVYHYICSNGCTGGAAGAGNCATCGNALTHNAAYHN